MAKIVNGVSGRGAENFIDPSSTMPDAFRARVSGLPDPAADLSLRRNPIWYTAGHVSILYRDEQVLWERWLNYPDQVWADDTLLRFQGEGVNLGLPDEFFDPPSTTNIPLTLRWAMRGSLTLEFWIGSF